MLIVEKYGGSSVATLSKIKKIAKHIKKSVEQKNKIVVVVSAMGKTTNKLLALAHKITDTPNKRELDVLLCTGEMQTISLLTLTLQSQNVKAISFCGFQAGIKTTNSFGKAFVKSVDIRRLEKALKTCDVIVVAGFQGIDCHQNLTTLGRGGSDTTAVALASKLGCPCNIFSDVNSLFTANPNVLKNPKPIHKICINQMLEMASLGAKVLDTRCLEIAKKFNVPIFLGKSLEKNKTKGSVIFVNENFEEPKVLAICDKDDLCVFEIKTTQNSLPQILKILEKENENLTDFGVSESCISFLVAKNNAKKVEKTLKNALKNAKIQIFENFCMISLVGFGFSTNPQILTKLFETLQKENLQIKNTKLGETKIFILLKQNEKQKTLDVLSELFKVTA